MKPPLRLLGTLLISGAFLAPQMLFPTQPALADKTGVCATPGKDGVGSGINGAVNTYYPGTSASGTSITVGTARGTTAIQPGDLLLIIQMQGADIDSTNTGTYGDGNSGNNGTTGLPANPANGYPNGNLNTNFTAGNFEYVVATNAVGTGGGTVTISTSLVNTYSNANFGAQGQRRFQVIRIPQYTSATLGGTVTALPWDGATGGVVAMDVAGTLNLGGGSINVTGQGFRGGGGRQLGGGTGANIDVRSLASVNTNAAKGEGTAGAPRYLYNATTNSLLDTGVEGYPNGSNGRGAPGNAGGGGSDGNPSSNDENSGGGGGSNGGVGGKGGNTWNSNLPYGGVGGAAFSVAAANRLVLGGGGGAGSTNNGTGTPGAGLASSGAAGGGSVMIRTGAIGTAGTITADGAAATLVPDNDSSGGGGAGGSVLVISQNNSAAGLTINARGGQGGTNTGGGAPHGPGGGGGGGTVFASPGTSAQLTGGSAGTTAGGGFGGAIGGTGLSAPVSVTSTNATTSIAGATCVPQLTVTKTTSTPTITAGGTATYTITVANAATKASATQVNISDALPTGFTYASLGSVNLSGGATRPAVTNPTAGATNPSFGQFTIPGGGQVQITFTVNVAAGTAPGTYQNPATATYLDPTRTTTTGTTTATYNPASSTGEDVTIPAPLSVSGTLYRDNDRSGTNTSEPGIGNIRVILYKDNDSNGEIDTTSEVIQQVNTLADGTYQFPNVAAGTYKIKVDIADTDVPTGYTLGTSDNLPITVSTTSITGRDFGFYPALICDWDAQVYSGHFPIAGAQAADAGAVGLYGPTGLPTLRGTAKFGTGLGKFTFNDQSIGATTHPLRTFINGTFPNQGYVPANGDYAANPIGNGDEPNWAIVFKRQVPTAGRVTIGQTGAYIDDAMEVYVNGVRTGNPVLAFTSSAPASSVTTVPVNAGDLVEIRLSNYGNVGGFRVNTEFAYDFGDAPNSYGEVSQASTCGVTPHLGATSTGESSQNYSATASADTGDDGVTLPANLVPGTTATITVNASTAGFLNSWIDFNENGVFDSGEQLNLTNVTTGAAATTNNVPLNAGNNTLTFTVPAGATLGSSFARFRFTTATVATPSPIGAGDAGEVEDYPVTIAAVAAVPNVLLVKRISAVNGANITTTIDDPGSTNDNAANWPAPLDATSGISTYLKGAINGGALKPGDLLEYTIYFLSNGGAAATNINLCDLVPSNSTFVPGSFSSAPESGINLTIGSTSTNLTNVPDADGGQFFNSGATTSVSCSATNTNGAVVVNVVKSPANLPNATAPGTPTNSYGFIRFRAKIN